MKLERMRKPMLALALAVALLSAAYATFINFAAHSILSVRVAGEFQHVSKRRLQAVMSEHLARGFFRVDVSKVRNAALSLPWVKEVRVRRVWPDSVHIAVVERVAVARWGETALLDAQASVFTPASLERQQALPHLRGPSGRQAEVLERFRVLDAVFAHVRGGVRRIELSARGVWTLELKHGPTLVLGKQPDAAAAERVAQTLTEVFRARGDEIERIDMRYTNGFAVRWKEPVPSASAG